MVLQLSVTRLTSDCCFLRVLSSAIPVNEQNIENADCVAGDDCDDGRDVPRSVLRSEGLRT